MIFWKISQRRAAPCHSRLKIHSYGGENSTAERRVALSLPFFSVAPVLKTPLFSWTFNLSRNSLRHHDSYGQAKSFDLDLWCLSMQRERERERESMHMQYTEIYSACTGTHPHNARTCKSTYHIRHITNDTTSTAHVRTYK